MIAKHSAELSANSVRIEFARDTLDSGTVIESVTVEIDGVGTTELVDRDDIKRLIDALAGLIS